MSKLPDEVRNTLRVHHYAMKTEKSYIQWIKRFIFFTTKDIQLEWANYSTGVVFVLWNACVHHSIIFELVGSRLQVWE